MWRDGKNCLSKSRAEIEVCRRNIDLHFATNSHFLGDEVKSLLEKLSFVSYWVRRHLYQGYYVHVLALIALIVYVVPGCPFPQKVFDSYFRVTSQLRSPTECISYIVLYLRVRNHSTWEGRDGLYQVGVVFTYFRKVLKQIIAILLVYEVLGTQICPGVEV